MKIASPARRIPWIALAMWAGCDSSDPAEEECAADSKPVVVKSNPTSEAAEYLALRVGAKWTYDNTDVNEPATAKNTVVTKEITGCETVTVVDCEEKVTRQYNAYVQETTGGGAGNEDSNKLYMVPLPEGVVRIRQDIVDNGEFEQIIYYGPYFMRLFEGPYDVGRSETYSHWRWELSAEDESLRAQVVRSYEHVVLATDDPVVVPQGSYDALKMERSEVGSDEDWQEFWYVQGVGKVREVDYAMDGSMTKSEELATFEAGAGTCD